VSFSWLNIFIPTYIDELCSLGQALYCRHVEKMY
jgi:hypothetical protein